MLPYTITHVPCLNMMRKSSNLLISVLQHKVNKEKNHSTHKHHLRFSVTIVCHLCMGRNIKWKWNKLEASVFKWRKGTIWFHDLILCLLWRVTMNTDDNLSICESFLNQDVPSSEILSSPPDSLPTFQMFREKKTKVEEELKYHYR